ncbi:hypothetical protein [Lysobacter gummosus]
MTSIGFAEGLANFAPRNARRLRRVDPAMQPPRARERFAGFLRDLPRPGL